MSKDSYWFRHDSTAGRGLKMRKIAHIYNHWGKGVYWDVVEMLRDSENYEYDNTEFDLLMLADLIGCKDPEKFINWYSDCVKFGLLIESKGKFSSPALSEVMESWEAKKTNGSKGGRPKKIKTETKPNQKLNETETKPNVKANHNHKRIEENIIEENIIENNTIKFISSFPDYDNLIKSDEVFIRNLFQELTGKWTFLELNNLHRDLGQKLINYKFYCDKYKIKLTDFKHLKNSFKKFALSHWNKNTTQIMNLK